MAKRVVEHHFKAAEHHELAALHQKEAPRLYEAGGPDAAAQQAQIAQGHLEHAVNHAAEDKERGRKNGHDLDDWLCAEDQVLGKRPGNSATAHEGTKSGITM